MISIEIPPSITFDLPAGNYRACITQIRQLRKQAKGKCKPWIRIIFAVCIPSMKQFTTLAGRNFALNLNAGSDLRNFLEPLLSPQFFQQHSGKQVDLECLRGIECDVKLEHQLAEGYEKPLVVVALALPVGSLNLTEKPQ